MRNVRNVKYIDSCQNGFTHAYTSFFLADKKKLQGFFDSTRGKFAHPTVKAWAEALYKEREELWSNESN